MNDDKRTLSLCAFCYKELTHEEERTMSHAEICRKHPAVRRAEMAEARVRELERMLKYVGIDPGLPS